MVIRQTCRFVSGAFNEAPFELQSMPPISHVANPSGSPATEAIANVSSLIEAMITPHQPTLINTLVGVSFLTLHFLILSRLPLQASSSEVLCGQRGSPFGACPASSPITVPSVVLAPVSPFFPHISFCVFNFVSISSSRFSSFCAFIRISSSLSWGYLGLGSHLLKK